MLTATRVRAGPQGRVHPSWERMIPTLQQGRRNTISTAAVIKQILYASIETWYHAIWLPRCKLTIEQERSQGLYQSAKLRRMQRRPPEGQRDTRETAIFFFLVA